MGDRRCSECRMLYPEEELLMREDNGQWVCPDCSGLMKEELQVLDCTHDE